MTLRDISPHGYPTAASTIIHGAVGFAVKDDGIGNYTGTGRLVLHVWDHNEAAHDIVITAHTKCGDRVLAALGRALIRAEEELAAGVD